MKWEQRNMPGDCSNFTDEDDSTDFWIKFENDLINENIRIFNELKTRVIMP